MNPDNDRGYSPYRDPAFDDSIDVREILRVLRRNIRLVLGLTLLCAGTATYLAYTRAPEYRAKAVLRLKNERQAMAGSIAGQGIEQMLGKTADPLLSEIQVLRSRTVTSEVADRIGMRLYSLTDGFSIADMSGIEVAAEAESDTLTLQFSAQGVEVRSSAGTQSAAYGQPVYASGARFTIAAHPPVEEATLAIRTIGQTTEEMLRHLTARAIDRTDVVEVEYTATDPRLAQLVVNTAVDVFQEVSVQNALTESTRRRVFIEEQLARTDASLAEAQLALSNFRQREEVLSSRDQFAARQAGMMDLDVRREELNADRRMYRALLDRLENDEDGSGLRTLVSSPGLAENPVISQAYAQLVLYQARRDSLIAGGRSSDNPDVKGLNSLIASTQLQLRDAVRSHIISVDAHVAALDTLRMRNAADIRALPDKEAEEMRLVQLVETARTIADQLRQEYQRAQIAEAVEVGQVDIVDLAALPHEPIGSGRSLRVVLGLMLGLMIGSGAAFLREHLDTAIRRRDEIEPLLNVPGLAVIPRLATMNGAGHRRLRGLDRLRLPNTRRSNGKAVVSRPLEDLVTVAHLRSPGAESYRNLRTNLMFSHDTDALKRIVVTSAFESEGKTTTSSNLAVTYAQQGLNVLLIDGDLRKARMHSVFGLPREPGLTELMLGMVESAQVLHATGVDGLTLLTSGTLPPNPSELLGGARMRQVLDRLGQQFDVMIIDGPPVLVAGDASILGLLADGVVLVLRAGQTHRGAAQSAVRQLRSVGARVIGAVLNDPDEKLPHDDSSYYYAATYYGESE